MKTILHLIGMIPHSPAYRNCFWIGFFCGAVCFGLGLIAAAIVLHAPLT